MLVDADTYFRAAREAMRAAQHSIFILSWDIDSQMRLVPYGANDGYPEPLANFLHALLSERHELEVWLLNWDFMLLYAMEREWPAMVRRGWTGHRRLHFCMDGRHPVGAAHHQKILVIDDAIAFVGGIDLTTARWDTSEHPLSHPSRMARDGKPYGPFHDVQAAVDGDAARALGELCRERWRRATRQSVGFNRHGGDRWPTWLPVDIADINVGISRTIPAYAGEVSAREVLQLHLDAIAAAKSSLLFENQYFTSGLIAEALAVRLSQQEGPEVVVITSEKHSGWLEEATMGVRRARLQAHLRKVDGGHRYRLLHPVLPTQQGGSLNLHSKIFFMDDRLCTIGSANLSNRSMACDTECNLSVEASGPDAPRIAAKIGILRARLLAEHLGTTPECILQALRERGSVSRAIDAFASSPRRLQDFDPVLPPELDALIPEQALFDPERPIDPEKLVTHTVPREVRAVLPRRLAGLMLLALTLSGLALAWRYTPMQDYLNPAVLIGTAEQIERLPLTPLLIIAAYVIGCLLMLPVMLLIAVTGIVFGLWPGAPYAMAGTLCAAAAGYGLGSALGRDAVRSLLGARLNRLSRRVARRGVLAMILVRLLPLAPFGVINILCGASHIRLRDYPLGTLVGMLPGVLLTTAFAHNLAQLVRRPSQQTLGVLLIVVLLLAGFAIGIRRLMQKQRSEQ